jgi:putative oxidoreductase
MSVSDQAVSILSRMQLVLRHLANVLNLAIRVYLAQVFFSSGLTKLRDWETTLALFQDEYHVPFVSPAIAAAMGTFGELVFPCFLVLGLGSRFAALGLSLVNVMAVVSYWHVLSMAEPALAQHINWGVLLLVILLHGPGAWSLDHWVWPALSRRR